MYIFEPPFRAVVIHGPPLAHKRPERACAGFESVSGGLGRFDHESQHRSSEGFLREVTVFSDISLVSRHRPAAGGHTMYNRTPSNIAY